MAMKLELRSEYSLEEAVGMTVGYASMCWNPRPTGDFDSTEASEAAQELIEWIKANWFIPPPGTPNPYPHDHSKCGIDTQVKEGNR